MTKIDDELFKRLVLINQYKILSHVDPDDSDTWERAAEQVRDHVPIDDLPSVDWLMEASRNPFTETDRNLVYDILQVYENLQLAEDEKKVTVAEPAKFAGFDGNHETKHMAYVRSLISDQGKWTYLRVSGKDFNSHCPMIETYTRMVEAWQALGEPHDLTAAQYQAIVDARVHPSRRS